MNNSELETSKQIDQARVQTAELEQEERNVGLQERIRASNLTTVGPSEEEYDYAGADAGGATFTPQEGGGIDIPNQYHKDRYVAGRRLTDGVLMTARNDPNDFGKVGFERMQAGYINTEKGAPPEAMEAVMPLMAEHIQNGGKLEDFDSPYESTMAADAHETLKATATIQGIVHELRSLPEAAELDAAPVDEEQPDLVLEDVMKDPEFVTAARVIRDYFGVEDYRAVPNTGGRTGTRELVDPTDAQMAEDMIEQMARTFSSAWKMGALIYGIESGDMSPEVQEAYLYAMQVYDKFTPWSMDVMQGTLTGIIDDAPGYLGTGGIGALIGKAASKKLMVQHVMKRLLASKAKTVATTTAATSAVGAVEGGVFGAGEELARQKVTGIENFDRVWKAGTNTAIAAAIITVPFGVLASKPGREFVVKAYHNIADSIGRSPSPMKSQGGWVGVSESETYNGIPVGIDDMGVPMADSSGTSYYSSLYRTAVEEGLIGNKETDPLKYLAVLEKRQQKGSFKGYEMQEAQLAEFLTKKADAGETVNKDLVDDFLWANRPRVNSLLSTADFYGGVASEMTSVYKTPKSIRRSAAVTAVKDNFFKAEEVLNAQGQKAWRITNKLTGEREITTSPGSSLATQTTALINNLSDDQVVQLVREYDRNTLLAPPRWGKEIGDRGTPTIVKGDNANNYQELRLFLPYGGMDNVDDIAMERFNGAFKDLTEREQKRVERIKGFAAEKRPESFREDKHYPLEHNRLVQIRTQELYQPQHGGERVLGVNEFQSDLRKALKASDKETEGGRYIIEDSYGNEIKQPDKQAIAGWVQMAMNRTMQLAQQQGYNKVAFPVDPDMIASIQLWAKPEERNEGVIRAYKSMAKLIMDDKKLKKTWGITDIKMDNVAAAPDGQFIEQKMMVITFDAPKGEKPIYGIGATAGAGGTMSIDAKNEEE